jgi:hypothetical protein
MAKEMILLLPQAPHKEKTLKSRINTNPHQFLILLFPRYSCLFVSIRGSAPGPPGFRRWLFCLKKTEI